MKLTETGQCMDVPMIQTNAGEMVLSERLELERVIERGKQSFFELGSALCEIRDRRGYKPDYKTFTEYCQKRWGWSRMGAAYYIDAAKVVGLLPPELSSQLDITHAAELARLVKSPAENGDGRKKEIDVVAIKQLAETVSLSGSTVRQLRHAIGQKKRDDHNAKIQAEEDSSATYENSTRSGWTVMGLEAGVGPNVMPVEYMWSSPRRMVTSHYASDTILRKLVEVSRVVKSQKKNDKSDLSSIPAAAGVRAAMFDEIQGVLTSAIRQVKQIIQNTDLMLKPIAEQASVVPTPPAYLGRPDAALLINSEQKNGTGKCAQIGCWNEIELEKDKIGFIYCPLHEDVEM